ncbi:hypothetical protein GCM10009744_12670 [Kribbella alba]|uniref:Uncharacterized protein n=1 Tax=Kribbella alba TaxID=190197 RepID=A0ABN2F1H0_9ACTN
MQISWKRWRLPLIAVLTALAVSVTFTGEAFAAEPGESDNWLAEHVGSQELSARNTVSEARNTNGDLLQVWRGETNNIVWLAYDGNDPFQLTNPDGTSTATYVSPTVVPYGTDSFMVFHTGTNGLIYYTQVNTVAGTWSGSWTAVPYQASNNTVAVAQLGTGSNQLYMVYRAANDDEIWGTRWNGSSWGGTQTIAGGTSPSAPSLAYNPGSGLWAAARGEDNGIWMSYSDNNGNQWGDWTPQGGSTTRPPTIAASGQTDQMLVSYVDSTYRPNWRTYGQYGAPTGGWSQDATGWQTIYSVGLSVVRNIMYAILTGQDGNVYYKQVYSS